MLQVTEISTKLKMIVFINTGYADVVVVMSQGGGHTWLLMNVLVHVELIRGYIVRVWFVRVCVCVCV